MIADCHARQCQLAGVFAHGDQGQVGRAAPDITYQNHVADFNLGAPILVAGIDPGIECRLRFFQQRDFFQARGPGGVDRQFPRHGIK